MNEIYNYIMNGAVDPFEKIIMFSLFLLVFEGIITMIVELIRMGRGR